MPSSRPNGQDEFVDHGERLARFGTEFIEAALSVSGRNVVFVEEEN